MGDGTTGYGSSSIGVAKEQIAAATVIVDEAIQALDGVGTSVADANHLMDEAAGDIGHEYVRDALGAYGEAKARLEGVVGALVAARDAGERYAAHI